MVWENVHNENKTHTHTHTQKRERERERERQTDRQRENINTVTELMKFFALDDQLMAWVSRYSSLLPSLKT